jgi:hypothetical protein
MTALIKTVGAVGVGSSAVLGCWLLWLARLLLIVALIIEIKVLVSLYKNKREYEQRRCKADQRPSEINKLLSQTLQPPAGNLCELRRCHQNLGMLDSNQRPSIISARILGQARNLLAMLLDFVLKLLRRHKSHGIVKQPNDPKLSHRHRNFGSDGNDGSQISWLNPKLKAQCRLAPARC